MSDAASGNGHSSAGASEGELEAASGPVEYLNEHPWAYWLSVAGAAGGVLAFSARAATTTSSRKRIENITLAVVAGGELLGLIRSRLHASGRAKEGLARASRS